MGSRLPHTAFPFDPEHLPKPADPARAAQARSAWLRAVARDDDAADVAAFAAKPGGRALLDAVFGNSTHLTQCLEREAPLLADILRRGIAPVFQGIVNELADEACWQANRAAAMAALRTARRRATLAIGLADIVGFWDLTTVTEKLSVFAEAALAGALDHLLHHGAAQGHFAPSPADERPSEQCGITILGMGKFGARELNYSSDIDLIVLYDPARLQHRNESTVHDDLQRLVRDLVTLLSERTREGYVARIDLRLRPDAGATPLALSTLAAEQYYESLGQNWERAAMIKARPVAGDRAVGAEFIERLRPFVWRKYLDFAAIQDIHSIKRQINAHRGHHEIAVAGHNIKLGRGGIREIEFYAQTQQLIWGGRDPTLREAATCDALRALVQAGRTTAPAAEDLIAAYGFLRRLEHRLQMVADEQTHTLPADNAGLDAIACFMGYPARAPFAHALRDHLTCVETHYAALFEDAPDLGGDGGNLVFTGTDDDPDTLATLASLGFGDGKAVSATVRGWHHGRIRATRSKRARELLTELMPALLHALAETVSPEAAFRKFDEFLRKLPAGVQLFSLFYSNPRLLSLVAEIMGSAPRLAEHLSRRPNLLDGVLSGDLDEALPSSEALSAALDGTLGESRDFQDVLDVTRRWQHDQEFQVGIQLLRNTIAADDAGRALSDVAETVIAALLPPVAAEFARVHGEVRDGAFAVLGMGKLGGREMTFESDLDVIFIYRAPHGLEAVSNGERPLPASQYYARLSQRLASALSVRTSEGGLYQIDTRLRPSGGSGPLASEITAFARYQKESAWTWEHMALTRARPIAGDPALCAEVTKTVHGILCARRERADLMRDVDEMRRRVDAERRTDNVWRMKHVRGGLLDLEFIAQSLQLAHAADDPGVLSVSTDIVFERLGASGLLPVADAAALARITRFVRRLQIILRLTVGKLRDPERFSADVRDALTRAAEVSSFRELEDHVSASQETVRKHYERYVSALAARTQGDPR